MKETTRLTNPLNTHSASDSDHKDWINLLSIGDATHQPYGGTTGTRAHGFGGKGRMTAALDPNRLKF